MLCAVLAGVQERVSAKADGKRMAETLGPQERVSAKADGKRMAEAYTPKARKPEARRPDERGGTYKRPRIDEGGSSSGRMKRKANFSCVNPTCRLLDEFPVSVMAQHCGVCVCFFFIMYVETGFISHMTGLHRRSHLPAQRAQDR